MRGCFVLDFLMAAEKGRDVAGDGAVLLARKLTRVSEDAPEDLLF